MTACSAPSLLPRVSSLARLRFPHDTPLRGRRRHHRRTQGLIDARLPACAGCLEMREQVLIQAQRDLGFRRGFLRPTLSGIPQTALGKELTTRLRPREIRRCPFGILVISRERIWFARHMRFSVPLERRRYLIVTTNKWPVKPALTLSRKSCAACRRDRQTSSRPCGSSSGTRGLRGGCRARRRGRGHEYGRGQADCGGQRQP
jgi:hypothetical protein